MYPRRIYELGCNSKYYQHCKSFHSGLLESEKMQFRIIDALFDPKAKINWFFNHAYVHFSYY